MPNNIKRIHIPGYNFVHDSSTGVSLRWGNKVEDDPDYSPIGPEIADIEITTKCNGPDGKVCKFCYKGNTPKGKNMSFEKFKEIFQVLPDSLTQIAFGADANLKANPDVWKIMQHCRDNNVIPNITVANVDLITSYKLSTLCGAVAVSRYENKNLCYDSVQRLSSFGLKQVNIHQLLSNETFEQALETIKDSRFDSRLSDLRSIVFLSLKQKERGKSFTVLPQEKFTYLVNFALDRKVPIGFDSCSAKKFLIAIKDNLKYEKLRTFTEPCESSCFSLYINVDGLYFPCSFSEKGSFGAAGDWTTGLPVKEGFLKNIWNHEKTIQFRSTLLEKKRSCPLFKI